AALPVQTAKEETHLASYKKWLQTSSVIKNHQEKQLALNYLEFLDSKNKKSADKVIFTLKKSSQKAQQPISYEQFGLFKNSADLIHKTDSLPTLSIKNLIPLIEQGNDSAIELFLVYSASAIVNPSEANLFSPISKILNEKYSEKVLSLSQKHSSFFQKFPPLMIQ
ncbi:hypothetical protein K2X05_07690, partial [bacterium]|nr:hypothetical protein [bacterium]